MSRRSVCLTLGGIAFALFVGIGVLIVLVRHEPLSFVRAPIPDEPAQLVGRSSEFLRQFSSLVSEINGAGEWDIKFTDEQFNSYFETDFVKQNVIHLPDGISSPRVVFDQDRIRLAFRYGRGLGSTIISVDFRVWLPKNSEPNVVAMELEGFHAGALPISAQSLLERVSEVGRQSNADIAWYRLNGHPVGLLRFGTDQPRTTVQLEAVQLRKGELRIKGRAIEPSMVHAGPVDAGGGQPGN